MVRQRNCVSLKIDGKSANQLPGIFKKIYKAAGTARIIEVTGPKGFAIKQICLISIIPQGKKLTLNVAAPVYRHVHKNKCIVSHGRNLR